MSDRPLLLARKTANWQTGVNTVRRLVDGDDEYNYENVTYTVAILLVLTTGLINGTFVGVRKNAIKDLDTISFLIIFTLGGFAFALPLYLAEGLSEASSFSSSSVACVFIAGLSMHLGDYLCFAASTKLHSAVIMAFTNLPALFLPICEYYISSSGLSLFSLWIMVVIMLFGIVFITGSEFPETASCGMIKSSSVKDVSDVDETAALLVGKDMFKDDIAPALLVGKDIFMNDRAPVDTISKEGWLLIGLIAGLLFCVWPLLDDFAESSGTGSIKNPAIVLFVFIIGEMGASAFILAIEFSNLLGISEIRPGETVWGNLCATKPRDILASFALGALCSSGYAGYFYSISELPVPVAYSLYLLEVPISSLAGIFLFGEYRDYSFDNFSFAMTFIFIGVVLYSTAIYVLLVDVDV